LEIISRGEFLLHSDKFVGKTHSQSKTYRIVPKPTKEAFVGSRVGNPANFRTMDSILIIDRELGFMWALAQQLQARGIVTIPSSSVREAQKVLAVVRPHLSLVIINCRCQGVCAFAEQLRKKYFALRIIGIVSRRFRCRECARYLMATLNDPEDRHPERVAKCAELVSILVAHKPLLQ
jgi:hypothetical protein